MIPKFGSPGKLLVSAPGLKPPQTRVGCVSFYLCKGSQYWEFTKNFAGATVGLPCGFIRESFRASECPSTKLITPVPKCRTGSTPSFFELESEPSRFINALGNHRLLPQALSGVGFLSDISKQSVGCNTCGRFIFSVVENTWVPNDDIVNGG
jgi:hypothetical protein